MVGTGQLGQRHTLRAAGHPRIQRVPVDVLVGIAGNDVHGDVRHLALEVHSSERRRDEEQPVQIVGFLARSPGDVGAEGVARQPQLVGVVDVAARPTERRDGVLGFALAVVERALGIAYAAEVEAQAVNAFSEEHVAYSVEHRILHGAAELGMGVAEHGRAFGVSARARQQAFDSPSASSDGDGFTHAFLPVLQRGPRDETHGGRMLATGARQDER